MDEDSLTKADDHFVAGESRKAAKLYSRVLECQDAGVGSLLDNTSSPWGEDYLADLLVAVDGKLALFPHEASHYLKKAAVLFLQNRWDDAREVLCVGHTKASEKTAIRHTIGQLNKLERKLDLAKNK